MSADKLRALLGPDFAVGATGYTFNGEPTSDPDQAYYQWAIVYDGEADDATQQLRAVQLPDEFVSMVRLQQSTTSRVLLVHEKAGWPRRYATATDGRPFPEDGLSAVSDDGERFVCWRIVWRDDCRWWPAGLPLRPLNDNGGRTWADLLAQVGPLTVVGYETKPAEFEG